MSSSRWPYLGYDVIWCYFLQLKDLVRTAVSLLLDSYIAWPEKFLSNSPSLALLDQFLLLSAVCASGSLKLAYISEDQKSFDGWLVACNQTTCRMIPFVLDRFLKSITCRWI